MPVRIKFDKNMFCGIWAWSESPLRAFQFVFQFFSVFSFFFTLPMSLADNQ